MNAPAHRKRSEDGDASRRFGPARIAVTIGAVAAVTAITAGVALAIGHHPPGGSHQAGGSHAHGSLTGAGIGATTSTTVPIVPLAVRSVSPGRKATGIATGDLVSVRFSTEPSRTSPTPVLSPAVTGHWVRTSRTWVFHPSAGFIPGTTETLTVPAATVADEGGRQVRLATAYRSTFTVGAGSTLRLQELLAELHYIPFTFTRTVTAPTAAGRSTSPPATAPSPITATTPASTATTSPTTVAPTTVPPTTVPPSTSPTTATTTSTTARTTTATTRQARTTAAILTGIASEPTVAADVSTVAERGTFAWAYGNIPASLSAQWSQGQPNGVTRGAVMAFEADHGLGVDGVAGPKVWSALVAAVAARQTDPRAYDFIEVTETLPETLRVWQNGDDDVYSSPANTGATGAATQLGTFPVYLRYTSHAMIGTEPDGTRYDDPDIQWIAYFNGGDAVHGYYRPSYGFPQSNGCVELPIDNAGAVFNSGEDWYGTLVNIT